MRRLEVHMTGKTILRNSICRFLGRSLILAAVAAMSAVVAAPSAWSKAEGFARANYVIPDEIQKKGITFAGVRVPLERREVSARVVDQINYLLMDRRAVMMESFDRMATYGPVVRKALQEEKVPDDLIYLSALLSDFTPTWRSRSGAVGWWALGAAKDKKSSSPPPWVTTNDWDDRRDPVNSTRIASSILQVILKKNCGGDWLLAAAAFVDGADRIESITHKAPGFSCWDVVLPPQSDVLVPRLIALKIVDGHRKYYGVDVPPVQPLEFDLLDGLKLSKDLPLHVVAKWCKISPRNAWSLNPGVDPSGGVLPKSDKKTSGGLPLRVPKGLGKKVRDLLAGGGYLSD